MTALTNFYTGYKRELRWLLIVGGLVLALLLLQPLLVDKKVSRMMMTTVTGLLVGGVYALIALGIVIINKASGVFNFAHGLMMLFGAMLFYSFFSVAQVNPLAAGALVLATALMVLTMGGRDSLRNPRNLALAAVAVVVLTALLSVQISGFQLIRAVIGGLVGAVLIGLCVERFAIRPLIGQPLFASVLMTLAVSEIMLGLTQMTWGSVEIPLQIFAGLNSLGIPTPIRFEDVIDGNITIRTELVITFILALVAFGAFVAFFRYTSVGLAMRATAENQELARSVGLRVRFILAIAWGIAALLAMVGGVLQGGATSLSLNMPALALRAFPAVLLGGLESIGGALVGGLIIGLVQEWANFLFPGTQAGTELAPYVVLMLVLVVRPDGLFGEKRIERI
ncbi:MAG: branched-chain amino acid ABC transporter permease [Anaerolineae bacterium]|nr:branched-chain amino acid ABC transporter permease [Anaerolineae bacterium]